MATVTGFHSSGRWDRSPSSLADNARRLRARASFGTRTEVGSKGRSAALRGHDDGWSIYHPATPYGLADCSVEWDTKVWRPRQSFWIPLTRIRVRTRKGFLLPPTIAVFTVLQHKDTGREVLVGSAHRNLKNTPLRRLARWREGQNLNRFFKRQRTRHPTREIVFQYDENSNQRLRVFRRRLFDTVQKGTALRNVWARHQPTRRGTHGMSLLDTSLTTMAGWAFVLEGDQSSDHNPFVVAYKLVQR